MSENVNLENDPFVKVTYKRKLKTKKYKSLGPISGCQNNEEISVDINVFLKRIEDCKLELLSTDLYDSVSASLCEGLTLLENPRVREIVCIGLGRFSQCLTSRYQLSLLLCLKDLYKVDVYASDPLFSNNEKVILERLGVKIIDENFEAKYKIKNRATTIFFLPHCPKQLTNNLLWANWGLNLNYCLLIANSFNDIIESCSSRELESSAEYIVKIFPYVLELGIINSFKYYEIFNNTAIHIFPINKLSLISKDFWEPHTEPVYEGIDVEYFKNVV